MSGPPTSQQIDDHLGALSRQLEAIEIELLGNMVKEGTGSGAEVVAVIAREDHTMAYAKAFLRSTGPMDVRKQEAILETHDERIAAELAEQVVRGLRTRMKTIQSRIDTGRTRSANVRSEVSIARTGAWGA